MYRQYVGVLGLCLCAFVVTACGNVVNPGTGVSVSVVLSPSIESEILSVSYFGEKSASGLVMSKFCYFFNVTAPDLVDPGIPVEPDTCGYGPRGKGKTFGAFAYGETAELILDPGLGRQFDLIGFKLPEGTTADCKGVLAFTPVGDGGTEKRLKITYDGKEIDPRLNDSQLPLPERSLFIFSRSAPTDIVSGAQTVEMKSVPWVDREYMGTVKSFPRRYSCNEPKAAKIEFRKPDDTVLPSLVLEGIKGVSTSAIVTLHNSGTVRATQVILSFQVGKVGLDTRDDWMLAVEGGQIPTPCAIYASDPDDDNDNLIAFNIPGKQSCNVRLNFYPTGAGVNVGSNPDKLKISYRNGSPVAVNDALDIDAVKKVPHLVADPVEFDTVNASSNSAAYYKEIFIENQGTAEAESIHATHTVITGSGISFKYGSYAASSDCDEGPLQPGESCSIMVKFEKNITSLTPTGLYVISFMISHDGVSGPVVPVKRNIVP